MDEETPNQDKPRRSSSRSGNRSQQRGSRGGSSSRGGTSKSGDSRIESRGNSALSTLFLWLGRIVILCMVVIAPWPLGAVHAQARFWLLAAAVAGLTMWWFSLAFSRSTRYTVPYLAFPVILGLGLLGLQLLPLGTFPSSVLAPKQTELYAEYSSPAESELLEDVVSPVPTKVRVTMDTDATQKMFNLLLLGLVGLMAGCYFFSSRKAIYLLPLTITVNGLVISSLGIVNRLSNSGIADNVLGIKLTQGGDPFACFVNRNNAAGYLLMCLAGSLAVMYGAFYRRPPAGTRPRKIVTSEYPIWKRASLKAGLFVAELNGYKVASMLATLVICFGITMTLSRGGIAAMIAALVVTSVYYGLSKKSPAAFIGLGLVGIMAGCVLYFSGYGDALSGRFEELNEQDQTSNIRIDHWAQTSPAIVDFMPMGSGLGGYINTHRLYRTSSEEKLFQHAENQYFQTLVETGIPGLLLLLLAIGILILCVRFIALRGNSPKTSAITVMGICLITGQLLAACFDFSLFIPANVVLMAVASGFLAGQAHSLADRLKKKYIFRFRVPQLVSMFVVLMIFAVSLFSLLSSYRYWAVAKAIDNSSLRNQNYVSMDLGTTDERIEELKTALDQVPDSGGLFHLANLYIYKYRMSVITSWCEKNGIPIEQSEQLDRIWSQTRLTRLHQQVNVARIINDQSRLKGLTEDPLVQECLIPAAYYLKLSRSRAPLQPEVHLLLGIVHGISPIANAELPHLQRASELAPANSMTALRSGILHLQANRVAEAIKSLKQCLTIEPKKYAMVAQVATAMIPLERVADEILPENPNLLGNFTRTYLKAKSAEPLKLKLYKRIKEIFGDRSLRDRKSLQTKAEVLEGLGEIKPAINTLETALDLHPEDTYFREWIIRLLMQEHLYKRALEQARTLGRVQNSSTRSTALIKLILQRQGQYEQR